MKWTGIKLHQFRVDVKPGYAWEVKEHLEDYLATAGEDDGPLKWGTSELWCLAERHPEKQRRYTAMGKMISAIKRTYPDFKTEFSFHPDYSVYVDTGAESSLLVYVNDAGTYEWEETTATALVVDKKVMRALSARPEE